MKLMIILAVMQGGVDNQEIEILSTGIGGAAHAGKSVVAVQFDCNSLLKHPRSETTGKHRRADKHILTQAFTYHNVDAQWFAIEHLIAKIKQYCEVEA